MHFKKIIVVINESPCIPKSGNRFDLPFANFASIPNLEKEIITYKTIVMTAITAQVIIKYFHSFKKLPSDAAAKYIAKTAAISNKSE